MFIHEVDKSIEVESYETNANGNYSDGNRIGRFTKASNKGHMNKSYEVTLQVGTEGSNFLDMSLDDTQLYNHILKYMESATVAKVYYKEKFIANPFSEDTPYEIYKVEPFVAPTLD